MTCAYCGQPIKTAAAHFKDKAYHLVHDENGNRVEKREDTCWSKSQQGKVSLQRH
jgi:hypothetical protein